MNGVDGSHAGGVAVKLVHIDDAGERETVFISASDAGGRFAEEVKTHPAGRYEMVIESGSYFQQFSCLKTANRSSRKLLSGSPCLIRMPATIFLSSWRRTAIPAGGHSDRHIADEYSGGIDVGNRVEYVTPDQADTLHGQGGRAWCAWVQCGQSHVVTQGLWPIG